MLTKTLISIFQRDLERLKNEISDYQHPEHLWQVRGSVANSAGNLTLHLLGNLNTYIGAILGNTGYQRDREKEFSAKNLPLVLLLEQITALSQTIENVLMKLDDDDLESEYPILVLDYKTSTEYFLVHLATHLTYHLGQISYHRRSFTKI